MRNFLFALLPLTLLLGGCTGEQKMFAAAAAEAAAEQADFRLKAMEWAWCKSPTHGAVMRRYGGKKIWMARVKVCFPELADEEQPGENVKSISITPSPPIAPNSPVGHTHPPGVPIN